MFGVVLILIDDGFTIDPVGLIVALVGATMVYVALWAYFRVHVSERGIRCYDFFGVYHFAEWSSITSVRPTSVLWLKYLRVYSLQSPRPLWLPLFLAEQKRFWSVVVAHASPTCPLLAYKT